MAECGHSCCNDRQEKKTRIKIVAVLIVINGIRFIEACMIAKVTVNTSPGELFIRKNRRLHRPVEQKTLFEGISESVGMLVVGESLTEERLVIKPNATARLATTNNASPSRNRIDIHDIGSVPLL